MKGAGSLLLIWQQPLVEGEVPPQPPPPPVGPPDGGRPRRRPADWFADWTLSMDTEACLALLLAASA